MRRPKPLGVKVREGIRHDFFNGYPHLVGGPGDGQQGNVTGLLAHGCVRLERRGDGWVAARGSQLPALEPSIDDAKIIQSLSKPMTLPRSIAIKTPARLLG